MRSNCSILGAAVVSLFAMLGNPGRLAAVDFAPAVSYPVGTSPSAIAFGDFNGDGKVDIAVANSRSGDVSILLGNGDGTVQAARNFSAGNLPSAIAVGDFNGDGKLDLVAFQSGVSASILLGNGDGTFQAPKTFTLSPTASFMAVADFNLDKKLDLAVCDSPNLDIFIGNGDGTFQPAKTTALSSRCSGVITADFNGDLKPDLALMAGAGIQILLGKGDGTFSQGALITVAGEFSADPVGVDSAVAVDLNQDGKADLLVISSQLVPCQFPPSCFNGPRIDSKISAFLGNGDGSFQAEQVVARASEQLGRIAPPGAPESITYSSEISTATESRIWPFDRPL